MRFLALALVCIAFAPLTAALAQFRTDVPEDDVVLEVMGIKATAEAMSEFLQRRLQGPGRPLTDAEADALIAQLGHDDFEMREKATKTLLSLPVLPLTRLRAASTHRDLEVRTRVEHILSLVTLRPEPISVVFRSAQEKKIRLEPHLVLSILDADPLPVVLETGRALLISQAFAEDLPLAQKLLASKSVEQQATGLRLWTVLEKEKALPRLRDLLREKVPALRLAAARALLDVDEQVDALAASLDAPPEQAVYLLRQAEWKMRLALKEKRKDAEAMADHQKLVAGYHEILKKVSGVQVERRPPQNTQHYLQLGMNTTKHPEILFYKIQWFAGEWSTWYCPGFNDGETSERNIRYWGCFNDHNFEVITTTRRDLFRPILDLDKP